MPERQQMDKKALQKLLHKVLVSKFNNNFLREMKHFGMTHVQLSTEAGKMENALSKSFTQVEDMRMSSFLRYWFVIQQILEERGKGERLDFSILLDSELLKMLEVSIQLSTFEVPDVAEREITFFQGLRAHVDGLIRKGSLSDNSPEVLAYDSLMSLYDSQEEV